MTEFPFDFPPLVNTAGDCPPDCGHSGAEHAAFDAGMIQGRIGSDDDENPFDPYTHGPECDAWVYGHSAGSCDR
jgi:hypothetical protein